MGTLDYVMTIDSDSEDFAIPVLSRTQPTKQDAEEVDLSPEFVFDVSGDPYIDIVGNDLDLEARGSKAVSPFLIVTLFEVQLRFLRILCL
jgi:hypothetical protein